MFQRKINPYPALEIEQFNIRERTERFCVSEPLLGSAFNLHDAGPLGRTDWVSECYARFTFELLRSERRL